MGKRLRKKGICPDLLLTSPAERALSTCLIIAEKIGYEQRNIHTDQRLYHASDTELLSIVHGLDQSTDQVMIFAHNPGLTDFVNRLSRAPVIDNIPTCGIIALELAVDSWKDVTWETGELDFLDYPKSEA
jgi:phosphohistidine phosphatase